VAPSNQATTLESQLIHMNQQLSGQTLSILKITIRSQAHVIGDGLISYGSAETIDGCRRAASYIGRILTPLRVVSVPKCGQRRYVRQLTSGNPVFSGIIGERGISNHATILPRDSSMKR